MMKSPANTGAPYLKGVLNSDGAWKRKRLGFMEIQGRETAGESLFRGPESITLDPQVRLENHVTIWSHSEFDLTRISYYTKFVS